MRSLALRRAGAGLLTTAALVLGIAGPSAASPSTAKPSATPARCCTFVFYYNPVVTQWTHREPNALNSTHAGPQSSRRCRQTEWAWLAPSWVLSYSMRKPGARTQ
jgi:hypothetical protein